MGDGDVVFIKYGHIASVDVDAVGGQQLGVQQAVLVDPGRGADLVVAVVDQQALAEVSGQGVTQGWIKGVDHYRLLKI